MSLLTNSSIALLPDGGKAGKLYSLIPTDGSGDFTVSRASSATRVNEQGLIEVVPADVPRIDFEEGTGCGSLLIEPQRTNTVQESADFSGYNLVGGASLGSTETAPDGTSTAQVVTGFSSAGNNIATNSNIRTSTGESNTGQTLTYSVWLKTTSGTGTISLASRFGTAGSSDVTHQQVTVTNEWQRFTFTKTYNIANGGSSYLVGIIRDTTDTLTEVVMWGTQLEEGSYATSYIPTSGSIVTRNVDLITGVNFGSLLNKNQGSFFAEVKPFDASQMRFALTSSPAAANNTIRITLSSNDIFTTNTENSLLATVSDSYVGNEYVKFIGTYSPTSVSTTVDGNARAVTLGDGSLTNDLELINFSAFVSTILFYGRIKALMVYTTDLDADASEVITGYSSFTEIANNKNYTVL